MTLKYNIKLILLYSATATVFLACLLYGVDKFFLEGISYVFHFNESMLDVNFYDALFQAFSIIIMGDAYFIFALACTLLLLMIGYLLVHVCVKYLFKLIQIQKVTSLFNIPNYPLPKTLEVVCRIFLFSYLFLIFTLPMIGLPYFEGIKYAKNLKHQIKQMFINNENNTKNGTTIFYYNDNGKTEIFQAYPVITGENMVVVYAKDCIIMLQKNAINKVTMVDND